MDDGAAYPRVGDSLDLRLSVHAVDLDAAGALSARVAEALRAFGAVTDVRPPLRFGHEASTLFTLGFEVRADAPAGATRQRLLEYLGEGWETKVQLERVSDDEAEECPVSEWVEAGYKKKRRRFAFEGVYGATLLGPVAVYQAFDAEDDDSAY
jgi:hypothetical protein